MEQNKNAIAEGAYKPKQGQYSPRKPKDTTPRVNPAMAVELVYAELRKVEAYTKRIEAAAAHRVQLDGEAIAAAESRLKNTLRLYEAQADKMAKGGYVDKTATMWAVIVAVVSLLFACLMVSLWTDAASDRERYKPYYEYYQQQQRQGK